MRNEANHRGKQIVSNKASANFFVVTGFYYTSEREPHATVDRRITYVLLVVVVVSSLLLIGLRFGRGMVPCLS